MKTPCIEVLFAAWLLAACAPVGVTAQAGYAQVALRGDIALTDDMGSGGTRQDFDSAFGLGDERGSPFVRAQVDFGVPVLTASGFWLRESGSGVLDETFGGLPAATPVDSDLELTVGKFSCTADIDLGPVTVSPGLAVDVFDLYFRVREQALGNSEEIDDILALPMLFVRVEGRFGGLRLGADCGYLEIPDLDRNNGRFFDLEALAEWTVLSEASVFCGYRFIDLDAKGDTDTQSFAVDLQIRGWFVGGGLRF
ncbi:MAG TPA: hypothetical protein VFZ65_03860 [Planctomycetota bacterium]|nr:hypothetical protein [Planctomycetota bacterium]